ncbi:MAG: glutamate synthase subunit beta [Bacteroidetes bacterium]|nr:glutamate synthase subunit beta [Bacteroidota bacterium]MBU1113533.1 glutamate synthase subunit beta [Bacteroidota bacterium]MBU1797481.1 glutamate synthase subunit beta [Bacteroidota bacterium]
MGEVKGFLKYDRLEVSKENVDSRIIHFNEFTKELTEDELKLQGARCMDCGIPFCQSGCPVDNLIPEWNDLVYKNKWDDAAKRLLSTNNFPEFTGRVCPAPCENSCVLDINTPAVTIKNIEKSIIEKAFENGLIKPNLSIVRTGKNIAIVGSGPAGLSAADQLNKLGHSITVFEKNEVIGGLLALGIPDFKLEKNIVERRIQIMQAEGVEFKTKTEIGVDKTLSELKDEYDAIILCGGAEQPRDLPIIGRALKGVHYAMDFLKQQNRRNENRDFSEEVISARDKNVVVIGGGDTGSDCIGTSIRQGAKSVLNLELLPQLPKVRSAVNPWPEWAFVDRVSTSHEEGCKREFSVLSKEFMGSKNIIQKIKIVRVEFENPDPKTGRRNMVEIPDSEFEVEADLVLLAMGFTGPVKNNLIHEMDIKLNDRNNIATDNNFMTNIDGIFAAGDMRRGQSLVVWAINEGRAVAASVDDYLK